MTFIKICGITTLDDARQAVEAGCDGLGFNFWPGSVRYLTAERAGEIIDGLRAPVLKVGVFVDAAPAEVEETARVAGLDVAQLHGEGALAPAMRWWRAWSANAERLRERMEASDAEAFLIDTPAGALRGGTGKTFDWTLARGLPGRIVLAGGLGPDNVAEAIEMVKPWGVDACSRLERAPGLKDYAKVAEFVRAARKIL